MLSPDGVDDEATVQDRIDELLRDGRSFVNADDSMNDSRERSPAADGPNDDIAIEIHSPQHLSISLDCPSSPAAE